MTYHSALTPTRTPSPSSEVATMQQTDGAAHKLKPRSFYKSAHLWVHSADFHPVWTAPDILIELRTTDCWLGVAGPTPSLTPLERRLQMVYLVPILSSDWTARGTTLLTTTSVHSGTIALTSSGIPTRLLRCALDELTTAISTAPVGVVSEYV